MPAQQELLSAMRVFQNATNHHDIDLIMETFAEEAEFELQGWTRLRGKEQICSAFEYDAGVNGEIQLVDCSIEGDGPGFRV